MEEYMMGIILLWLLSLASALLLVAVITSLASKLKRLKIRLIVPILLALAPLIAGVGATGYAYKWAAPKFPWLFGYTLSWTLVYVLGAAYILMRGMRAQEDEFAACRWPRSRLAFSFVVFLVLYWCILLILDNKVCLKLAVIRSEAVSVALALHPPRVPEHLNAVPIYEKALEAIEEKKWPDWWGEIGEPAFDVSKNEAGKFLEGKKEGIALLQRAASMPAYYVEANYLTGDIPWFFPYKNAASLLSLDARFQAANGSTEAGLKSVAAVRNMAAHLSTIPSVAANLMSAAIQNLGTRTAENILSQGHPLPPGVLEKLIATTPGLQQSFIRALRMDEAFMAYASTSHLTINPASLRFPLGDLLYRAVLLYDELTSARNILLEAHAIAAKPYWKTANDWKSWQKSVKAFHGLITAIAPTYGRGMEIKILAAEAGDGLTSLALATSAYQADHDAYPESLEDLTPEHISHIPTDPFNGEPLKLAAVEGGLILYSVGPDLVDDGGTKDYDFEQETRGDKSGDITFVMGAAFADRRLKPSKEFLEERLKQHNPRTKKR